MPIKGTKALEAVKSTTVVTTYTTEEAVAPAAGHLAVYIDVAAADAHRRLEIWNKLKTLMDRAREINYGKPTAAAYYLRVPIDGSKASIALTATRTLIVEGDVALGISASVRSGDSGSILFDSCFEQIIDKMFEQDLKTDSAPTIKVNTGGTIDEGATLAITSSMLRATDKDSSDPDLAFSVTSGPANGQLNDDIRTDISSFTQGDINDGIIQYVHDGTDTITGDFGFSVSDGTNELAGQTFVITVTPVAD